VRRKKRGMYMLEFNIEVVRLVKGGQAVSVTAKVLGIPKVSLDNWVKLSAKGLLKGESPRVLRRLQTLRRWSHEQEIESFFTRNARTRCAHGAGASWRVPLFVGCN